MIDFILKLHFKVLCWSDCLVIFLSHFISGQRRRYSQLLDGRRERSAANLRSRRDAKTRVRYGKKIEISQSRWIFFSHLFRTAHKCFLFISPKHLVLHLSWKKNIVLLSTRNRHFNCSHWILQSILKCRFCVGPRTLQQKRPA